MCGRVKAPVIHVIVWSIMETHKYCMLLDLAWTYTIFLFKEVGHLKSKTRQRLANTKLGIFFQPGRTVTEAPNKTSSASWPSSSTYTTSFSFSYSSAATSFCFFFFFNKLKLKSSKVHSTRSRAQWKMLAFLETIATTGRAMSSWPIMKSHMDNSWLQYTKKKEKKKSCTSCWKMQPVLIFCR